MRCHVLASHQYILICQLPSVVARLIIRQGCLVSSCSILCLKIWPTLYHDYHKLLLFFDQSTYHPSTISLYLTSNYCIYLSTSICLLSVCCLSIYPSINHLCKPSNRSKEYQKNQMISSTMANLGAVLAIWIPPARKAEVEDNSEAVLDSAATDAQHVRDPELWMEIDETKALCRCVRVGSKCTHWNLLHILRIPTQVDSP